MHGHGVLRGWLNRSPPARVSRTCLLARHDWHRQRRFPVHACGGNQSPAICSGDYISRNGDGLVRAARVMVLLDPELLETVTHLGHHSPHAHAGTATVEFVTSRSF